MSNPSNSVPQSPEQQNSEATSPALEPVLTDQDFAQIMDAPKVITGDINWQWRDKTLSAYAFRADIYIGEASPIFVQGHFKLPARSLSYTIVHRTEGRIYSLDMGHPHGHPNDRPRQAPMHKHTWSEANENAQNVYIPSDITAPVSEPVNVWNEFCEEANINHNGTMSDPLLDTEARETQERRQ